MSSTPLSSTPSASGTVGRYSIHGVWLELHGQIPALQPQIDALLAPFAQTHATPGIHPITGDVRPYNQAEVLRHLSSTAVRLAIPGEVTEIYREGERFWLVDDRWGMVELNVIKGTWRSWVLPRPTIDPHRCVERAVLWPAAQLLRARGLHLLPAAAAVRDGWGVLLIAPFNIEPELVALIRAGYRLVGQRWIALRQVHDGGGRIELLHIPGKVERAQAPVFRGTQGNTAPCWVDLGSEYCGSEQTRALCDAVALVQPGRRVIGQAIELTPERALDDLRRAWPIPELHRTRGQLQMRLAQNCRCCDMHFSRRPEDVLPLLDALHSPASPAPLANASHSSFTSRRFVPALVRA